MSGRPRCVNEPTFSGYSPEKAAGSALLGRWSIPTTAALRQLVSDAAGGLFAAGVAAWIALCWRRREVVIVAMVALLAFALPQTMFHLAHPADALSDSEDLINMVTLSVAVAIAVAIMLVALRRDHPSNRVLGARQDAGD